MKSPIPFVSASCPLRVCFVFGSCNHGGETVQTGRWQLVEMGSIGINL